MKYAVIIGNNDYNDPKLSQLTTPSADSQALATVLKQANLGNFDAVRLVPNSTEVIARREISNFFLDKKRDDLVLLYFSGHGVLDDIGGLFLAFKDTEIRSLNATAISSSFITYEMDHCRSNKQILILDCCYSGAFRRGTKGQQKAITKATFEGNVGSGRFVLTASDSTQHALEGDQVISQTELSLFTHFLIEGLQTGHADLNHDGFISLDEWYEYSHTRVTAETYQQTPQKWAYEQKGTLIIAQNPFVQNKSADIEFIEQDLIQLLRSRESELYREMEKLEPLSSEHRVHLMEQWKKEYEDIFRYVIERLDQYKALMRDDWSKAESDRLYSAISLLSEVMGGSDKFIKNLGEVSFRKADIGIHGAEAMAHQVSFSSKGSFSAWTVIHELAHAWDANYGWKLSRRLEKYTGGFTNPVLSYMKQLTGLSDTGFLAPENKPGRYGRKPGCNRAGYFYGDKPSGSNWGFNRIEDFAESVAMYIGWETNNELSQHARNRIVRYQLQNGERDSFNVMDNWEDYRVLLLS